MAKLSVVVYLFDADMTHFRWQFHYGFTRKDIKAITLFICRTSQRVNTADFKKRSSSVLLKGVIVSCCYTERDYNLFIVSYMRFICSIFIMMFFSTFMSLSKYKKGVTVVSKHKTVIVLPHAVSHAHLYRCVSLWWQLME